MKIGIIGTGRIAKRFVPEAMCVPGAEITAVYNPHPGSAERFVREVWGDTAAGKLPEGIADNKATVPKAYAFAAKEGSRESGVDPGTSCIPEDFWNVTDAVYIATPHETHYEYILKALRQGKHVLCEKPMTLSSKEAAECFQFAEEKGLILMEGLKTAYCPGYRELLQTVSDGIIGEVKFVESCFTKLESPDRRELTDRGYGGSFTELGSYVLLPILDLFGSGYESVRFSSIRNGLGIDTFTKLDLDYPGRMASAVCGLGVKAEGRLLISGTKGFIKADAPWWKTRHFEIHFEDPSKMQSFDIPFEGDGLRYEIGEFQRQIEGICEEATDGPDEEDRKAAKDRSICMADLMEKHLKAGGRA
ncbi:MAG: Gfo/Idh/MocA family oxidoreductase [Lachnospiraceae bacterium]|nr:Gfo/Idh/MocA family oxidoreductase [Lachnospiraceae bacterium]